MAELLIATDLDQTLLFSPAATGRLGGGLPASPVEILDGVVVSELADVVATALRALPALLVPATTRTPAQLARIHWPAPMPWAVAASGAVILAGGEPDPDWAAEVRRATADAAPEPAARAVLAALVGDRARVRSAGTFAYAVGEAETLAARTPEITAAAGTLGWRAVHQVRKLYLLPVGLDKAAAVRRVAALVGATTVWAAGDSLLDASLVATAARAWVPRGSPLAATALGAHVTVTRRPGHAAAAEIARAWGAGGPPPCSPAAHGATEDEAAGDARA